MRPPQPQILRHSRGAFGGNLLGRSNPKSRRHISTRTPMHIVLRSSRARGHWSLLTRAREVERILLRQARSFDISLLEIANVGNHLHLMLRLRNPKSLARFLRAIAGLLARAITGRERGHRLRWVKFWDTRPFSRIVSGRADERSMRRYIMLNRLETVGIDKLSGRAMFKRIDALLRGLRFQPIEGF